MVQKQKKIVAPASEAVLELYPEEELGTALAPTLHTPAGEQEDLNEVLPRFSAPYALFIPKPDLVLDILVLAGVPYYRERRLSGEPKATDNTWFHFRGMGRQQHRQDLRQHSTVLDGRRLYRSNENPIHFPLYVLGMVDSKKDPVGKRFFNLSTLCMSSLLGGGYWETARGEALQQALTQKYRKEHRKAQASFNQLDLLDIDSLESHQPDVETGSCKALNTWLEQYVNPDIQIGVGQEPIQDETHSYHYYSKTENAKFVGCSVQ